MVFPTLEFVLFLAVVMALNLTTDGRPGWRKGMLVAASYVFYAAWDVRLTLLLAFVSLLAWAAGLFVHLPRWRRPVMIVAITGFLATLGWFKYANFFVLSLALLLASLGLERDIVWAGVILPVGISFYTFHGISYVVDCAQGKVAARRNPVDVAFYVSFFPHLVAGPIVRAADFLPQIDRPTPPHAAIRAEAMVLILGGLVKKMVIANYLAVMVVDPVFAFPDQHGAAMAWAALVGYAVQIYCDFSGYSDIAIGVALLLGYRFRENFAQPYRARSLREFWRRWHISLSTFIRDYLYIPLGGRRGGVFRQGIVLMVTMTLAGLWHGAAAVFILWGALHGAGLALERWGRHAGLRLPGPLALPATFAFVTALWLPFRAHDIESVRQMAAALFRQGDAGPAAAVLVLIALGLVMNLAPLRLREGAIGAVARCPRAVQALMLGAGTMAIFALSQEGTAPFIYFQF